MKLAFSTLEVELRRLANDRKTYHLQDVPEKGASIERPLKDERSDLLNNLVKASMMDEGDLEVGGKASVTQKGLSDEEIVGNTYIYFL